MLRSLEPNSSRIGCDKVYSSSKLCSSWEEVVFGNIVDAIHYCNNGPRFVSMDLEKAEIVFLDI